jgi:hypothetical protein
MEMAWHARTMFGIALVDVTTITKRHVEGHGPTKGAVGARAERTPQGPVKTRQAVNGRRALA